MFELQTKSISCFLIKSFDTKKKIKNYKSKHFSLLQYNRVGTFFPRNYNLNETCTYIARH